MLEVQKYLRSAGTLATLQTDYGIKSIVSNDGRRVILNYSMIDSPKTHPLVMECRGLTLEMGTWKIVAMSFKRFFNYGEAVEITGNFDWTNCTASTKMDGSLAKLYWYDGAWHFNTRGSYGDSEMIPGITWSQAFFDVLPDGVLDKLDKSFTYVFEYVGPFNKVVVRYDKPELYLLGMFLNETGVEYTGVDEVAAKYGFKRPASYSVSTPEALKDFIEETAEHELFEGFVVQDSSGLRLKVKGTKYVSLHHMHDNGNLFLDKNLITWVLHNEKDELLAYFPEVEPFYRDLDKRVFMALGTLVGVFVQSMKYLHDQKEFALYITKENPTPFSSLLFKLKQNNEYTIEALKELWIQSEDLILKVLKK